VTTYLHVNLLCDQKTNINRSNAFSILRADRQLGMVKQVTFFFRPAP